MSAFEQRMQEIARSLTPAAKALVKHVVTVEHKRRFSDDRSDLPDDFARRALLEAKDKETGR